MTFVLTVQACQMAGSAALMAWYDWKLFSLMILMAPFIWMVNEHYRLEMGRRLRKVQELSLIHIWGVALGLSSPTRLRLSSRAGTRARVSSTVARMGWPEAIGGTRTAKEPCAGGGS